MTNSTLRTAATALTLVLLAACGDDQATSSQAAATPAVESTSAAAAAENGASPTAAPAQSSAPSVAAAAEPAPAPAAEDTAPPAATAPEQEPAPAAAAAPEPAAASSAPDGAPTYVVSCPPDANAAEQCQVDKDTYIGWRTFAAQCQVCHGGSALGSTFAPNLLDRFQHTVDYPRFVDVVLHGFTGQVGAMPAWKGNPNVEPHIDRMYMYLKARADGVLPAGRPGRSP